MIGTAGGDLVICSFGTNIRGSISSSDGGCGCQGRAKVVRVFLAFCGTHSDNMGNKESKVGIFSLNDGINLSKFPIVEEVKLISVLVIR